MSRLVTRASCAVDRGDPEIRAGTPPCNVELAAQTCSSGRATATLRARTLLPQAGAAEGRQESSETQTSTWPLSVPSRTVARSHPANPRSARAPVTACRHGARGLTPPSSAHPHCALTSAEEQGPRSPRPPASGTRLTLQERQAGVELGGAVAEVQAAARGPRAPAPRRHAVLLEQNCDHLSETGSKAFAFTGKSRRATACLCHL